MLLHALIPAGRANGPGLRAVVFFQGCKVGCVGCWILTYAHDQRLERGSGSADAARG